MNRFCSCLSAMSCCSKRFEEVHMHRLVRREKKRSVSDETELHFSPREESLGIRPVSAPTRRRSLWVQVSDSPCSGITVRNEGYRVDIEYPLELVDSVYVNYDLMSTP